MNLSVALFPLMVALVSTTDEPQKFKSTTLKRAESLGFGSPLSDHISFGPDGLTVGAVHIGDEEIKAGSVTMGNGLKIGDRVIVEENGTRKRKLRSKLRRKPERRNSVKRKNQSSSKSKGYTLISPVRHGQNGELWSSFQESVDHFLENVAALLTQYEPYVFRTWDGISYLVKGLGNINLLEADGVRISNLDQNEISYIEIDITIGAFTFYSSLSQSKEMEHLSRQFRIQGQIILAIDTMNGNRMKLKNFEINDHVMDSRNLSNEQLDILNEFFESLMRTDFVGTMKEILKVAIDDENAREIFDGFK